MPVRRAILSGWLACGVLDITAACVQAWAQAGRTPSAVLRGVASAVFGGAAIAGGAAMALVGLAMHFLVALTATLVFVGLARRVRWLRTGPLALVAPLYGAVVFGAMNYGTLPLLSVMRSMTMGGTPRWPGPMEWPQFLIHLVCVGLPIVWGVRRAREFRE